jgi:hypothetical protein
VSKRDLILLAERRVPPYRCGHPDAYDQYVAQIADEVLSWTGEEVSVRYVRTVLRRTDREVMVRTYRPPREPKPPPCEEVCHYLHTDVLVCPDCDDRIEEDGDDAPVYCPSCGCQMVEL